MSIIATARPAPSVQSSKGEMDKAFLELWKDRADFWALIFAFVVGVGVVGEFVAHFAYRYCSRKLEPILADEDRQLRQNVADANARAAQANEKTAELQAQNLELEKMLEPRRLPPDVKSKAQLEGFAGTHVLIQSVPDFEAMRLGMQVAWVLNNLGWKPSRVDEKETHISPLSIHDGVTIYDRDPSGPSLTNPRADKAAVALSQYLETHGIRSFQTGLSAIRSRLPESNVILVLIGAKPLSAEIEDRLSTPK